MSDNTIQRFIGEVKETLAATATDSMLFPKPEPFGHGVQCGNYQGLQRALDILDNILRGDEEKEKHS